MKCFATLKTGKVDDARRWLQSASGGSRDKELKEFTVVP